MAFKGQMKQLLDSVFFCCKISNGSVCVVRPNIEHNPINFMHKTDCLPQEIVNNTQLNIVLLYSIYSFIVEHTIVVQCHYNP